MVTMDTQITSRFNHSLELKKHLAKLIRGVEKRTTTAPAIAAAKLLFFLDN
jgi:hypothetical protein